MTTLGYIKVDVLLKEYVIGPHAWLVWVKLLMIPGRVQEKYIVYRRSKQLQIKDD